MLGDNHVNLYPLLLGNIKVRIGRYLKSDSLILFDFP